VSRRLLAVALAFVAAVGLLGAPVATREVSAATPDLTIVADARYDVQPAQRRVRVTLTLTLANHLTDTKTTRYYFDKAFLAVLPGTKAFSMSWDGSGTPSVTVSKTTKAYTLLRLGLAQRLYSGKTATYRLRFDLPDPGGSATRDLRIGDSLASFPVWGFGSDSTSGGSVTVVFPKGFTVAVQAGSIPKPVTDATGRVIFHSGTLSNPLSFFAYLVADRPGAYTSTARKAIVEGDPVALTMQSWPDDKAWSKRVGDLMAKALPVLGDRVGLAWPQAPTLTVREAVSHSTGGYAGLFDPAKGLVEIAYYADPFVVLHESAHGWFNGSLLADRWANEGFASYYALQAAAALKVKATGDVLTTKLKAARIPLNAWGPIGRDTGATEDYAYAASLALAKAIGERATPDVLQAVWADAAGHVGAYQPPSGGTPETVEGAPDWRGLLDLLETESGNAFDDLWRTWVARDEDLPLLDARAAARARYDQVVGDAGDWTLPRPIRDAMRAWRFDDATGMLDEASTILARRATIETNAAAVGLTPSPALESAFEGDDGFADAVAEADAEDIAIAAYRDAVATRPATADPITTLGLWGVDPEADVTSARAAFEAGDLVASAHAADAAETTWTSATSLGQGRAISIAMLLAAVLLAVILAIAWVRGRHGRRRRSRMQAHRIKS